MQTLCLDHVRHGARGEHVADNVYVMLMLPCLRWCGWGSVHVCHVCVDLRFQDFNEQSSSQKNPQQNQKHPMQTCRFALDVCCAVASHSTFRANKTFWLFVLVSERHCVQCCFSISNIDRFTRFSKAPTLFLFACCMATLTNFSVILCLAFNLLHIWRTFTHIALRYFL